MRGRPGAVPVDTVDARLEKERLRAFDEAEAELLRLVAHPYFRGTDAEPGLRIAASAVRRLVDSRNIRVADPDDSDMLEVWEDIEPGSLAATVRRLPAVDDVCRECGRDYRRCAAGPFVCVHRTDCSRGRKLAA